MPLLAALNFLHALLRLLAAIIAAAETNAALKTWWEKFKLARDINLDDPATQGGVQALEIAGLIGEGRAAEVLA